MRRLIKPNTISSSSCAAIRLFLYSRFWPLSTLLTLHPVIGSALTTASPNGLLHFVPSSAISRTRCICLRMKAAWSRSERQERNMSYIITPQELEHCSEPELRSKYCQILNDLAREHHTKQNWPLAMISLQNIQTAIGRRRQLRPKF